MPSLTDRTNGWYWKMSIDLSCPLVLSMGQHDPLDGYITFSELEQTAVRDFGQSQKMSLIGEITGMAGICRHSGFCDKRSARARRSSFRLPASGIAYEQVRLRVWRPRRIDVRMPRFMG